LNPFFFANLLNASKSLQLKVLRNGKYIVTRKMLMCTTVFVVQPHESSILSYMRQQLAHMPELASSLTSTELSELTATTTTTETTKKCGGDNINGHGQRQ